MRLLLPERAQRRSKADSSLTSWPGRESNRKLSGAGRRADLYSTLGVQRNFGDLCSSKLEESFSGTGRRLNIGKNFANFA